jgi:glycerophosphoryl diester phosphodiesterase
VLRILRSKVGRILVESHRGSQCGAPENTWPALELGYERGADLIEVDVQASRDGVAFLRHPYRLEDGRLARECDWAELAAMQIDGEAFPRLDEVLEWAERRGVFLTLDLKDGFGDTRRVVVSAESAVAAASAFERVVAFGWNHPALRGWKERHPESLTRVGIRGRLVDTVAAATAARADSVGLAYDLARREDIEVLHEHEIGVALAEMWEPAFETAVALGVDIVCWGDPAQARRAFDRIDQPSNAGLQIRGQSEHDSD